MADFRIYQGMDSSEFLAHYGVGHLQGGHSGRYPYGSGKKNKSVFVSGSSKTQDPDSAYYRANLPKAVSSELDRRMKNGDKILVGDAPGIDRQVQDYLNKANYNNVEIYGPGKSVRYQANSKWKSNPIDAPEFEEGSKEWLAKKDKAMSDAADEGLAIILDEGAKATRKNIERLLADNKPVQVYELNKASDALDKWLDFYGDYTLKDIKDKRNGKIQKETSSR